MIPFAYKHPMIFQSETITMYKGIVPKDWQPPKGKMIFRCYYGEDLVTVTATKKIEGSIHLAEIAKQHSIFFKKEIDYNLITN
jgi:hypothetical protein